MPLTHRKRGVVNILALSDPLPAAAAPETRQRLDAMIAAGQGKTILDLAGVEWLDPDGIALLALICQVSRARDGRVVLMKPRPALRPVLAVTRLDLFLPVFDDETAAIAYLNGQPGRAYGTALDPEPSLSPGAGEFQ